MAKPETDTERKEEVKFYGESELAEVERYRRKCMKGMVERS